MARTWVYSSMRTRVSRSALPLSGANVNTAPSGDGLPSMTRYTFLM